jgi:hypothetical protein
MLTRRLPKKCIGSIGTECEETLAAARQAQDFSMMINNLRMRFSAAALATVILVVSGATRAHAQSVTFEFDAPIDLGSNLERIGGVSWNHTLGTEWDTRIQLGGIIGSQNTTIFPAVPNPFGPGNLIDPLVADTRTGLRLRGNLTGGTGLEFYADFNASGLESGAAFQFRPRIENLPAQVSRGEFLNLRTTPGIVDTAAFTENLIALPSFEAGMNFYFNLDANGSIDYGLFPLVPYNSIPVNLGPLNVNQNLIKFGFDLDPESNNGQGLPPSLVILENTPFENSIGLLDDGQFIAEKQFSVDMTVKDSPIKQRMDIGSAHLVNPFGTGESLLGPNERNLTITTEISDASMQYQFESPILRLGLDLDGLAAYFGSAALTGAGHSFTRIDEKFLNDQISLTGDLIDVKYGPEIGYRETVTVNPDFAVTVNFDRPVAIDDGGQISIVNSWSGDWSELPAIALVDDQAVQASVNFNQVTGEQTKQSAFYLSDNLELTLFELESLKFGDAVELSLPPLYQSRGSVLGNLLGQVELPINELSETIGPFAPGTGLTGANSFTLTPAPSTMTYLATPGANFSAAPIAWRKFSSNVAPISLENAVLVIASDGISAQTVADLDVEQITDSGAALSVVTSVAGLVIPEGSQFTQTGARTWSLPKVDNDGLYLGNGLTRIGGLLVTLGGQGEMRFTGPLEADAIGLSHGADHTLTLHDPQPFGSGANAITAHRLSTQRFENAGQISIEGAATLAASEHFSNRGNIVVTGGQSVLRTPELANDGRIEVRGPATMLTVSQPDAFGAVNVQSRTGSGRFVADNGATLRFANEVLLDTQDVEPNPVRFEATTGGTIRFDRPIRAFDAGVGELHVDETSSMILNGIEVMRRDAQVSLVNRGLVEVRAGANRLYYNPAGSFGDDPPPPEAEIVGINVVNEGTIRVQPSAEVSFALFGFEAEIKNYVPGGATLGPGTWEVIGQTPATPYKNDRGATSVAGQRTAVLEILVARISNEDTYLGRIDFGDTNGDGINDGHSAEDYDTSLAISEANVLLSGAARFDYFNTLRENRGAFTLRNKNHFDTAGGLLNRGEIRIEGRSRLNMLGDLTIDEGTVFVDSTSILDIKGHTTEVIGGNLTIQRGAGPLYLNTRYVIREKWDGVDAEGNDIVREARVSFGDMGIPTISIHGEVLLDGKRAVFEPLAQLNRVLGKLTLTGGNELNLGHSFTNEGTVILSQAGKLFVNGVVTNWRRLEVGAESFLEASDNVRMRGGSMQLDGVVHTSMLTTHAGTTLSGTGRITGALNLDGSYLAEIISPDSSGESHSLIVDGQVTLGGPLQLVLANYVPGAADSFTIVDGGSAPEDSTVAGAFSNVAAGDRLDVVGGFGSFVVNYGSTSPLDPNQITLTDFEPALAADLNLDGIVDRSDVARFVAHFGMMSGADWSHGDLDGDGTTTLSDLSLLQASLGQSLPSPAAEFAFGESLGEDRAAVPEPTSWLLAISAICWSLALRRVDAASRQVNGSISKWNA